MPKTRNRTNGEHEKTLNDSFCWMHLTRATPHILRYDFRPMLSNNLEKRASLPSGANLGFTASHTNHTSRSATAIQINESVFVFTQTHIDDGAIAS